MHNSVACNEVFTAVSPGDGRRSRAKRPRAADLDDHSQTRRMSRGWFLATRPDPEATADDYLARQSEFQGPVKLYRGPRGIRRQVEVYLPAESTAGQFSAVDPEQSEQSDGLDDDIRAMAQSLLDGHPPLNAWNPPDLAARLAGWLAEQGREAIADKQGNLRWTVRCEGCDGQARIDCGTDRLRLTMPLGQWAELSPAGKRAIRLLAAEANDRTRLERIACAPHGKSGLRVEAQVDLTGLPGGNDFHRAAEALWREMIRLAADALELALRRLGLELPALADPQCGDLAELLLRRQESFDENHRAS
jgi:hypothetical protein